MITRPLINNLQFYERSVPLSVSEVVPESSVPPVPYNNVMLKNDLNDSFDRKAVLKKVPKSWKSNALRLLEIFDERPSELTWDSSGHIYIDEQAIPNSNFFVLFPYLFRKVKPTKLTGFSDFKSKVEEMGLKHLILPYKGHEKESKNNELNEKKSKNVELQNSNFQSTSSNWWYIGD